MAAFHMAVNAGADMIELDVRRTRDDQLIVHHDRRLGRTSDGRGAIRNMSARDLEQVDAGGWFAARFRRERIPTLLRVFEELPPRIGINIEVKTDGDSGNKQSFARLVADAVIRSGRSRVVIVSSFDHRFLARLHRLAPAVSTGALYLPVRDRLRGFARIRRHTGASMFICSRAQLRLRVVRNARAAGMTVSVYGVNTPAHLDVALHAGIDGVITDYPGRLLRAFRSL
jgi:glycerophosphoryl diester phosphodiesterase